MLIGPAALGLIDIKADSALDQIILMTILIQAPTTEWLGRKLRLLEEK